MDATRLDTILKDIYIPHSGDKSSRDIPNHHPSLIMQDSYTDTTHHLDCGCCGGACITEQAWWIKQQEHQQARRANNAAKRPSVSSTESSSSVMSFKSRNASTEEF